MANRRVIRGDSDTFQVKFMHSSVNKLGIETKTPVDITGWDIRFTVRKDIPATSIRNDNNALISKSAIIEDGESGVATFYITPEETNINEGAYWYDIQYTKPDGTIKSIPKGKYIVDSDITRDSY